MKFYRPDLKLAHPRDYPCIDGEHDDCVGITPPYKCGCECHEVEGLPEVEIEIEAEGSHAKAA